MTQITHASDRMGYTPCEAGNVSGTHRANTDRHPDRRDLVTCPDCVTALNAGWTMSEHTAKLIAR